MTHKSNDYKLSAVNYYLVEDKTQEELFINLISKWAFEMRKDVNCCITTLPFIIIKVVVDIEKRITHVFYFVG